MLDKAYVYGLLDPRTQQIRYCGKSKNLIERYRTHLNCWGSKFLDYPTEREKIEWIRDLRSAGLKPKLVILEEVKDGAGIDGSFMAERRWQHRLLAEGHPLINRVNGADPLMGEEPGKCLIQEALKLGQEMFGSRAVE